MGKMNDILIIKLEKLDLALRDAICAKCCDEPNAPRLKQRYRSMRKRFVAETGFGLNLVGGYHEIA